MKLTQLSFSLQSLCVYQELGEQALLTEVKALLMGLTTQGEYPSCVHQVLGNYGKIFSLLREGGHQSIGEYLWDVLRYQSTLYGALVSEGRSDPALQNGARREVETLIALAKLDCDALLDALRPSIPLDDQSFLGDLPRWSNRCPFDFDLLTAFHQECGCGVFAQYQHFIYRNRTLMPLTQVASRPYDRMRGYRLQREQVYQNTKQLVQEHKAQNILLFGDGGTGKSAVVKSMAWEFPRLRLIQIDHDSLRFLPELVIELQKSSYPFVLFIDDLAFDFDDNTYSALKSILEGGLETPPSHVVIYATSNRRHLVRQTFTERAGEEVDMMETIAEKTALAQRFGLRIPYMSMNQEEYLGLVDYLYQQEERGIASLSTEELHHDAMQWEIRRGGRTPRVAEQFIRSLGG